MSAIAPIEKYTIPVPSELPKSTAQWTVNTDRAVLLVHDMQRYFLEPFQTTQRDALIKNCQSLREFCVTNDMPVIYTAQPGDMTDQQRGLLKDIWGPGMRSDPMDQKIVDELKPGISDHLLTKWRYSAFYRSDLRERILEEGRDQIVICGVYAHVGVLVTALEAFSYGIRALCSRDNNSGDMSMNTTSFVNSLFEDTSKPFALLYRPEATGTDKLEIMKGDVHYKSLLADIPLQDENTDSVSGSNDVFVLVPHKQITERGFDAVDDGSSVIVMSLSQRKVFQLEDVLTCLPDEQIDILDREFDIDDDLYAATVHSVLQDAIGTGEGSNFVIKRSFLASIDNYSIRSAATLFRRLITQEAGTYWTFLIHTGSRTFVGATPERHVSLENGVAVMNPISGTYRYPEEGPSKSGILSFLSDQKEADELYMVLDEELKMMARICDRGGRVEGPYVREMARLAHTEYYIKGQTSLDPRDILRETMLAPTVTGSPLENACNVIARYEKDGRGYYGGIAALISHDKAGSSTMDSAILIRTADIERTQSDRIGRVKIGVGATLVRHSDANSEVAETHAKAAGVLGALGIGEKEVPSRSRAGFKPLGLSSDVDVVKALARRNSNISKFWFTDVNSRNIPHRVLSGQRTLIIDCEDTFTAMLAHQLSAIGLDVSVVRFDDIYNLDDEYDFVVLGPGPGDPRQSDHPKMLHMSSVINQVLQTKTPFLAVCLSHQLLCHRLGLEICRREIPNQGTQKKINLFGSSMQVGFYNSFNAISSSSLIRCPGIGDVEVCRNADTEEVYALRGKYFSSVQFHIESVLTQKGEAIFLQLIAPLLLSKQAVSA